jgi:tetratricopeptide (TPR) repeat protein
LLRRRGQLADAETQLRDTLARARQLGDSALAGIVATNLALVLLDQDDGQGGDEAVTLLQQAFAALQAPDYLLERAAALHNLGEAYCRVDVQQAEDCFRQEVALAGEMRTVGPLIDAHDRLGVFLAEQGRYPEAEASLREAVRLCDGGFEPRRRARTLGNLGALYLRRAQPAGDQAGLRRAVQILTESDRWFGHVDVPQLHAAALDNLGRAQFWLGDREQGVATLRRSIEQFRRWPQGKQRADQIQAELDALAST